MWRLNKIRSDYRQTNKNKKLHQPGALSGVQKFVSLQQLYPHYFQGLACSGD